MLLGRKRGSIVADQRGAGNGKRSDLDLLGELERADEFLR
jgi:hypothetical protein